MWVEMRSGRYVGRDKIGAGTWVGTKTGDGTGVVYEQG